MTPPAIDAETDILVIVDIQNDFCPGGALAIPEGDAAARLAGRLSERFAHVMLTQDWHPAGHRSFASAHPGARPYDTVQMDYGLQTLWPDHCVQGTEGAEFHPALTARNVELILRKGYRHEIDSYSVFFENDRRTPTGLGGYLRERNFRRVLLAGLAFDFCVLWSAEDARKLGFEAIVIEDACRALGLDGSATAARARMAAAGVEITNWDLA